MARGRSNVLVRKSGVSYSSDSLSELDEISIFYNQCRESEAFFQSLYSSSFYKLSFAYICLPAQHVDELLYQRLSNLSVQVQIEESSNPSFEVICQNCEVSGSVAIKKVLEAITTKK
ncbi:hypothetical protein POM88_045166 [Heracleum sosnowskyi]|uniref:Uncharacterized protein n=1 Tax=Heracleum sosnowskyi TaxID=360622 RepID=A0AAD8M5X5_9APIA|nr:hypothetical protein POM88_045166 [Heracleum sosnowskyi]